MSSGTRVGDVLASKYRLEELLGSGGMGHVYRAVNEDVGRVVAIKVLRSEHATNAPIVERFLREARAANLVRHPNVVDVLDIGRDGDGSPFIVQELLQGQDLAKYVEGRGGKLSLEEIQDFLLPVIDAVAEAHARGVVHRDIKPENVFIAEQGNRRVPKLLDFGISKIKLPDIRATEVGVMMGTPAYMAPEQIQGSSRDADPRSDVWALGIMLFELLAGHLPFADVTDAPQLFVAIATRDIPKLIDVCPETPPDVSRVAERCLRRIPDERYPSALELARDFRHVLDGTELESTQKRSLRPAALLAATEGPIEKEGGGGGRGFDIPDLVFPASKGTIDLVKKKKVPEPAPAPKTISGFPGAIGLRNTELSKSPTAPGAPVPVAPIANSPAAPVSSRGSAPSSSRSLAANPSDGEMQGVMLSGASATSRRRPVANAFLPDPHAEQAAQRSVQDLSLLIGLAAIGLSSIGATAVLMTFAHEPGGWPIVQLVTSSPAPTLSLVVQGGIGAVGFVLAARFAIAGVKKWRGDLDGGRPSAIFNALLAGGFFFAALELARAAW